MKKKELLNYLRNGLYVRLRASKIEGVGVYAVRDIPEGINPFRTSDQESIHFTTKELADLPAGVREVIRDYCVEEDGGVWIPDEGFDPIDVSYFLNHSKTPNMKTEDGENFITARAIKKDEELTVDYETYSGDYSDKKGY